MKKEQFEIELRALLSQKQYARLSQELSQKMKLINEDTIYTTQYRPGHIKLKYSNKAIEIVCKDGSPLALSRKEIRIPLESKEQLDSFAQILTQLKLTADPAWISHKKEFEYAFGGFTYLISLQHIENFAFLVEVEFLSEKNDSRIHEPNIRAILKELDCEPVNNQKFAQKIQAYRDQYAKL
ncbi:hypothetical protein KKE06_00980 [Candidatus Micrarchaeota archaeon]|nr:hypothetical protein [Candidatus Micrarchaeota archaeon]MBU1929878.1 hypothetical protein [Candidatus Micrarchaeota archaeon]